MQLFSVLFSPLPVFNLLAEVSLCDRALISAAVWVWDVGVRNTNMPTCNV